MWLDKNVIETEAIVINSTIVRYRSRKDFIVKLWPWKRLECVQHRLQLGENTCRVFCYVCQCQCWILIFSPALMCFSWWQLLPPSGHQAAVPPTWGFRFDFFSSLYTASCSVTSRSYLTLTACIKAKQSTDVADCIKLHLKNKTKRETTTISSPFRPDKRNNSITISTDLCIPFFNRRHMLGFSVQAVWGMKSPALNSLSYLFLST